PGVQHGGLLDEQRSATSGGFDHLHGAIAGVSRSGEARPAGTRKTRGFGARRREKHFVAAKRVGGGGSAEGGVRRSGAAERARRSLRVHGGKHFRGEGRENFHTSAELGMFGRSDAGNPDGDRARRGIFRGGAGAAAGGFVFRGRGVHFVDEPEFAGGRRNRG